MALDSLSQAELPELSGRLKELYIKLQDKSQSLADMYYGGIFALSFSDNPEYLSQAAHSFRELMDHLPRYLDVEIEDDGRLLKDEVMRLQIWFEKISDICSNKATSEHISKEISDYLNESNSFFEWFKSKRPSLERATSLMIENIDCSKRELPSNIKKRKLKTWKEIRRLFLSVLHHGKSVDKKSLEDFQFRLEGFLLELLIPETSSDFAALDDLIAEGESI